METRHDASTQPAALPKGFGWGARIRTWEWRNQNPLPYHLATPQSKKRLLTRRFCRRKVRSVRDHVEHEGRT